MGNTLPNDDRNEIWSTSLSAGGDVLGEVANEGL